MATRIVGIGASAGGVEALEDFFEQLPNDLQAAFVVIQHLSPDHSSSMADILQQTTRMPVKSLEENTVPQHSHVYVKAPNRNVVITSEGLRLSPRPAKSDGLYLPIDDFFFSLAEEEDDRAIGIVLSGMGSDGSRGIRAIREAGGLVLVQDPASARFNGMPRAVTRHNLADVKGRPAELAARLAKILKSGRLIPEPVADLSTLTEVEVVTQLLERIYRITQIDFRAYQRATILRRIEKRMLVAGYEDLGEYVAFAIEDDGELQFLRQSFLIGVTRFFRDAAAFEVFREEILPTLFPTDDGGDEEVRIWVPACSSGEEVYSHVILIEEYLRKHRLDRRYKIFGSDIDRQAVAKASAGEYDHSIKADVPAELLQRYFYPEPYGYRIVNELKERILFAVQNLLSDPPFIRIDYLACRNFLIYIGYDAQFKILANFHFSLNNDGVLFLGPSENLGELSVYFRPVNRRWKFFEKRTRAGEKDLLKQRISTYSPTVSEPCASNDQTPTAPIEQSEGRPDTKFSRPEPSLTRKAPVDQFSRYLADLHAPSTLFVDRDYNVLYLSGRFEGILRLPRYTNQLTLRTIVMEDVQDMLILGVDRVLETGTTAALDSVQFRQPSGEMVERRLRFSRVTIDEREGPVVQLTFLPTLNDNRAEQSEAKDEALEHYLETRYLNRIKNLETELLISEQQTQKLHNELEATNEELQSSNRELLASNEEMQSTNEELQSVNEELYTVNAEFQRKNEELNDINNDVSNLLKSTQINTVFVDNKLTIRRFTPGVSQLFDLNSSDVGRPITSFATPFSDLDIASVCREVYDTNQRYDQEINDGNGNYFLLRVLPYLTEDEAVEGVVITFLDIGDLIETRKQLVDIAHKYRAISDHAREVIAIVGESGRIEEINQRLANRSVEALIGSYLTDAIASSDDKVRFSDALRFTIDTGQVNNIQINLRDGQSAVSHVQVDLIPLDRIQDKDGKLQANQAMVIFHDVTDIIKKEKESQKIIARYEVQLREGDRGAGLIDMDENIVTLNRVGMFKDDPERFLASNLAGFLNDEGLSKFREALVRLRKGEDLVTVTYPLEELLDDDRSRTVRYQPVREDSGRLIFVSFEIIDPES